MTTESKFLIYGLKDPNTNEIRYIGKSCSGLKRPREHSTPSNLKNKKTHTVSWIKSLQGIKHTIDILEIGNNHLELIDLEIKWIRFAKDNGWKLTNHTSGGDGINHYRHTDESRKKIAKASKKMWKTNPYKFTEDAKYRCGNSSRGKTFSYQVRNNMAKVQGTVPFRVICAKTSNLLGTWENISECARYLKVDRRTISSVLKENKKHKKFKIERVI